MGVHDGPRCWRQSGWHSQARANPQANLLAIRAHAHFGAANGKARMNAHTRLRMTKVEFRRWVEERPEHERYELVNREPRMMVRVERAHDVIVTNWILALGARLDRKRFQIHTGEFAVSTNAQT
jgi:hypothetical protein